MKTILSLAIAASVLLPGLAFAQNGQTVAPLNGNSQTVAPGASAQTATAHLENPLAGVNSVSDLFYKVINFLISFSYIVIAFFLILSGFKFVKAQGNESELESAKKTFYFTIVGAAVIIGAQTITAIVQGIISGLNK